MRKRNWMRFAILATSVAALVVGAVVAVAQQADDPFGPPGDAAGQQGGQRGMRGGMMGPMMFGGGGDAAIAIEDGSVFVVSGGTLYKFSAETLELQAKVVFVEPPAFGGWGGPPGGGGAGAAGGAGGGRARGGAAAGEPTAEAE